MRECDQPEIWKDGFSPTLGPSNDLQIVPLGCEAFIGSLGISSFPQHAGGARRRRTWDQVFVELESRWAAAVSR